MGGFTLEGGRLILEKLCGGHALTCIKTATVKGLEGNMATLTNAICFLKFKLFIVSTRDVLGGASSFFLLVYILS